MATDPFRSQPNQSYAPQAQSPRQPRRADAQAGGSYIRQLDSASTDYSGANIETITTIGTYQAPSSSSKVRFKEVDSTHFKGVYEIHFHDSATAFGSADASENVTINILETSTSALKIGPNLTHIHLVAWDPADSVRLGLTSLPNAAAGANGGLPLSVDASGRVDVLKVNGTSQTAGDIYPKVSGLTFTVSNQVDVNAKSWAGGTIPATNVAGVPLVDAKYLLGTIFATPATAGVMDINVKNINNVVYGSCELHTLASHDPGATIGTSTYAGADTSGTTTLLSRLTALRAGYLDNLSVGPVALATNLTGDPYSYLVTNMGLLGVNLTAADDAVMTRLGTPAGASVSADIAAVKSDTGGLVTTVGALGAGLTGIPKTGYKLASDGLDSVATTAPTGVASNFREMLVQVWRRFFKRTVKDATTIKTYGDNGTSVVTTQSYTSAGGTDDVGAAS